MKNQNEKSEFHLTTNTTNYPPSHMYPLPQKTLQIPIINSTFYPKSQAINKMLKQKIQA